MKNLKMFIIPTLFILVSCSPKIKVEAPDKPVEINLNVKISHEVRVKLDKEIDSLIESRPDLF